MFPGDTPYAQQWSATLAPGCPVNVARITMSPHVGAHADAPLHYHPEGAAIGALDLEPYLGPCRVIHAIGRTPLVRWADLEHALDDLPPRVLVRTYERMPVDRWDPHLAAFAPDTIEQPLAGWWGHAAPFEFTPGYRPAPGIARYLCGTQPILSMVALQCGIDTVLAAQPLGGMAALRRKSLALTDLFIALVEARCAGHGLALVTPREHARRGSQVCLSRTEGAYAIVQALIARGVIGDFRAGSADGATPDILRFGFTPLYTGFEDVWHAADHLQQVLQGGEWRRPEFKRRHAVT